MVTLFFSRLVDRKDSLTNVLRTLDHATVACVGQRLGYCNIYNAARPSLFYRLRMWRADDQVIANSLARVAARSTTSCYKSFAVNGELRKITEGNSVGAASACLIPRVHVAVRLARENASFTQSEPAPHKHGNRGVAGAVRGAVTHVASGSDTQSAATCLRTCRHHDHDAKQLPLGRGSHVRCGH